MSRKRGRASLVDGQVIATIKDKFGESREVVQRGSRIRVANSDTTLPLAMNREVAVLVGERVRAARKARGFALEELAMRCGITSGWPKHRMYEIETASRSQGMRMGTLYAIAAALGVEATTLLPTVAEVMKKAEVERVNADVMVLLSSKGKVVG